MITEKKKKFFVASWCIKQFNCIGNNNNNNNNDNNCNNSNDDEDDTTTNNDNNNKNKYLDLARKLKDLFNMKVTVIVIVDGVLGTVPKALKRKWGN